MNKHVFFILSVVCISTFALGQNLGQISRQQIMPLFDSIVNDINRIDAEAIEVRNKTKSVTWDQYVAYHTERFEKAESMIDLKRCFLDFGSGFTCGHSHFAFLFEMEEKSSVITEKPSCSLGFTYPNPTFFNVVSKKTISQINGKDINEVFDLFLNYQTKSNTENRAASEFVVKFNSGRLKVDDKIPSFIKYSDGTEEQIEYKKAEKFNDSFDIKIDLNQYADWEIVAHGYKVALLKKENIALVKIKNFGYPNFSNDDIRCGKEAPDSSMCMDVQLLREGLKRISSEVDYLIFDLQGNSGGNENSPFLKNFSPDDFFDLSVQFKKTKLLEVDSIRNALSYGNPNAERWFELIQKKGIYNETNYGQFLPARGDFCQGSKNCKLKPIKPLNRGMKKFKKIVLLTNERTASSADDFVFRMKQSKNVLLAGQIQSADLTYSLITAYYFLDSQNQIKRVFVGNQGQYQPNGTPLLQFDIPYSKTIDKDGNMLQGSPANLDIQIPITKENYFFREKFVLNEVYNYLKAIP